MRKVLLTLSVATLAAATAVPALGAGSGEIATYELNEGSGATTMVDASGNGLDGRIGNTVLTGVTFENGTTGYRFPRLKPNTPPAVPEHNVLVPHSDTLNPGVGDYSVEVRYRTTNPFGNLIQKGQSTTKGGYWKIQLPQGEPACLFRDAARNTNAVRSANRIDDGAWHTIKCVNTAGDQGQVELFIDGVLAGRNRGVMGSIANTQPLSFGGKNDCDQVNTTCDYFGGDVDFVHIARPGATSDAKPTAVFPAPSCSELTCAFDGSGSSDPEGSVTYAWDFGDQSTGTGPTPSHTYASSGTYTVTLTVTDTAGQSSSTTRSVVVPTSPSTTGIVFDGRGIATGNSATPTVTAPNLKAGDTMLMYLSVNRNTTATAPDGWTLVGSQLGANNEVLGKVWRKTAVAADAGKPVRVTLGASSKYDLVLAAYTGVDTTDPVAQAASASETVFRPTHTTPSVSAVTGGDVLLSYWTDKTTDSADWAPPAGQVQRAEVIGTGTGRVNALLTEGDSGSGGLTATSGAGSKKAVMWSIVLNGS